MEVHPEVGYVFCPGFGMRDHEETCLLEYSRHGDEDTMFDGREFLCKLLKGNSVVAASGMVRNGFTKTWVFSLSISPMPATGISGVYSRPPLRGGLFCRANGQLPRTSVEHHYRFHGRSANAWKAEGIAVSWRIKRAVETTEHRWLASQCNDSIVRQYASSLARYGLTPVEFEQSLCEFATNPDEAKQIRVRSYLRGGDSAFGIGDRRRAATLYGMVLRSTPANFESLLRYITTKIGKHCDHIRKLIGAVRHGIRPGRVSRP